MIQETLLMDFVAFILAIFLLRVFRYFVTGVFCTVEDWLRDTFPRKDSLFRDFFLKIDYLVNKMRILGIRWHILVAFLYVCYIQFHLLHKI